MSFGFSISDITSLIQATHRTYQGWKTACGEYTDIIKELDTLNSVLSLVELEIKSPSLLLLYSDHGLNRLKAIISNCDDVVVQLEDVVRKYKGLGPSRRSNWDRIKFGQQNLNTLREKLTLQVSALGVYLNAIGVRTLGRIEKQVTDLPKMKKAIDDLTAEFRAGRRECSVMTTYDNDDKEVWRQFRRELIAEGFSSEDLKKSRSHLRRYVKRIANAGLLDEEVPEEPESCVHGLGHHAENPNNFAGEYRDSLSQPADVTATGDRAEGCLTEVDSDRSVVSHLQPTVDTEDFDTESHIINYDDGQYKGLQSINDKASHGSRLRILNGQFFIGTAQIPHHCPVESFSHEHGSSSLSDSGVEKDIPLVVETSCIEAVAGIESPPSPRREPNPDVNSEEASPIDSLGTTAGKADGMFEKYMENISHDSVSNLKPPATANEFQRAPPWDGSDPMQEGADATTKVSETAVSSIWSSNIVESTKIGGRGERKQIFDQVILENRPQQQWSSIRDRGRASAKLKDMVPPIADDSPRPRRAETGPLVPKVRSSHQNRRHQIRSPSPKHDQQEATLNQSQSLLPPARIIQIPRKRPFTRSRRILMFFS